MDELQRAIDALPAAGGRIVVRAGTYTLTASIEIRRDDVVIEGEGPATHFRLDNNQNKPCFILGEPTPEEVTTTHRNITLARMRIDGNRSNQTSETSTETGRTHLRNNCITVRRCVDSTIEDVILENARSGGVVTEKGCDNILLSRIIASGNHFDGIACYVTTRSHIIDCTSRNNLAAGLSCDLGFRDSIIADCLFIDNGTVGVFWRDCTGNLLSDCRLSDNVQDGVFVTDGDPPGNLPTSENVFEANFYTNNGRHGFWQAGANSVNNVLDGGLFQGNGQNAIEESFPATAPLIRYDVTLLP